MTNFLSCVIVSWKHTSLELEYRSPSRCVWKLSIEASPLYPTVLVIRVPDPLSIHSLNKNKNKDNSSYRQLCHAWFLAQAWSWLSLASIGYNYI